MTYQNGAAFRRALEDRLAAQSAKTGVPLVRLRKLVVFDRFMARLVAADSDAWVLKGGLALQLRLGKRARTTKDMDVLLLDGRLDVQDALASAAVTDLGDFFSFTLRPGTDLLLGPDRGGVRFFINSLVGGKLFESFHVDVGSGDPVIDPVDSLTAPPLLAFAGIAPVTIKCYPLTQHLAEKLHAYVRPRATGESTRVKDLVDIMLIAEHTEIDGRSLRAAIQATFDAQGSGPPPERVPLAPAFWTVAFKKLAEEVGLRGSTLSEAGEVTHRFLDPILDGSTQGRWSPSEQVWID